MTSMTELPGLSPSQLSEKAEHRTISPTRRILQDFVSYIRKPTYNRATSLLQYETPIKKAWYLFRAQLLLTLFLATGAYVLTNYVEELTGISLRQQHSINNWWLVLIIFTLIPLLEESIFRLLLRPSVTKIWWMVLALGIELSVHIYFRTSGNLGYLILTGTWVGLVLLARLAVINKHFLKNLWKRNFSLLFYASSIAFGLIHLVNCDELTSWHWLLAPIITLPQLTAGFFNGYVRMNYGFWYAVAMHVMTNSLSAVMAAISLLSHS